MSTPVALELDAHAVEVLRHRPEVRIDADIHAIGGPADHRVPPDLLRAWGTHTRGAFTHTEFDGGHFYLDGHLADVARLVSDSE